MFSRSMILFASWRGEMATKTGRKPTYIIQIFQHFSIRKGGIRHQKAVLIEHARRPRQPSLRRAVPESDEPSFCTLPKILIFVA